MTNFPKPSGATLKPNSSVSAFDEYLHPEAAKEGFPRRVFGAIGAERLVTDAAREVLRAAPAGETVNNRLHSISVGWREGGDDYHWLNQEARADPVVRDAIADLDFVRDHLRLKVGDTEPVEDLDVALEALGRLRSRLNDTAIPDRSLLRRAEGSFAQGVHKLVNSGHIDADTPSKTITQLVGWIEDASRLANPEVDKDTETEFEKFSSWGSPSARIEAAEAALDLCLKRPEVYPDLKSLIDRLLSDQHPAVRMNAAIHLVRIWDIDRAGFWARTTHLVEAEENRSVLDTFVCNTLDRIQWHEARHVADLVLPLFKRCPAGDPRNTSIRKHLVEMTLQFWLRFGFEDAANQVRAWFAQTVDNVEEVRVAIQWLRSAFTIGLRTDDAAELATQRPLSIDLLIQAVTQAGQTLGHYNTLSTPADAETERARKAVQIIDTACQQLYFSSGAFRHGDDKPAPLTPESAGIFLHETSPVLRQIGEHGGPHTVYYLIQLLEYLVEVDPPGVFDLIAFAVLRGGRQAGYQFEHLAADLMVKLVGRFLADHKEIFDDPKRRTALVDSLEVFVAAGWPSVRRLFYRLPELLQ